MKQDAVRTRRWTRREYDRMIDRGVFGPHDRLELLDGLLVIKEPQDTPFGPGWLVRAQAPVAAGRRSQPEPDVYVVPGAPRDYLREHPTRPALVVEVAHSRLRLDRARRRSTRGPASKISGS